MPRAGVAVLVVFMVPGLGSSAVASAAAAGRARRKPPGHAVIEEALRRSPPPRPSGNLHLLHVYRRESLKVNIFNPDGSYDIEALRAVSRLLRCVRTDVEKDVDPRLLVVLSHIYDHFGERRIEVTSGYRNQRRTSSYHYRGTATDILVPGVKLAALRAFAESLDTGGMGIGLYPRAGFVHVDIRPPPSYRWIDYAPVDHGDPDRRPPRGFFKKKNRLQSGIPRQSIFVASWVPPQTTRRPWPPPRRCSARRGRWANGTACWSGRGSWCAAARCPSRAGWWWGGRPTPICASIRRPSPASTPSC